MPAPTWNAESELPVYSYSVSNTQDYVEHILTNHEEKTDNPLIRIYVNKIENIIKTEFYLKI